MVFRVFEDGNTIYLGIPIDLILDYLQKATDAKHSQLEKQIAGEQLASILQVRAVNDSMQADMIESTVMEQITESMKTVSQRAEWIKTPVSFGKRAQCYLYITPNLVDLNKKRHLSLRLKELCNLLSTRHEGVVYKETYPKDRCLATIRIPAALYKDFIAARSGKQSTIDLSKLTDSSEVTSDTPAKLKEDNNEVKINGIPALSKEESEIAGLVLDVLDAGVHDNIISVRSRIESAIGKEIELDVFTNVITSLVSSGLIENQDMRLVKKN